MTTLETVIIPKPGSNENPCTEECTHPAHVEMARKADTKCPECGCRCGYGLKLVVDQRGVLRHYLCQLNATTRATAAELRHVASARAMTEAGSAIAGKTKRDAALTVLKNMIAEETESLKLLADIAHDDAMKRAVQHLRMHHDRLEAHIRKAFP